jgi:hypothetical protein
VWAPAGLAAGAATTAIFAYHGSQFALTKVVFQAETTFVAPQSMFTPDIEVKFLLFFT